MGYGKGMVEDSQGEVRVDGIRGAALSAHLPGNLALWCSVAFMYAMCQFTANKYDTKVEGKRKEEA